MDTEKPKQSRCPQCGGVEFVEGKIPPISLKRCFGMFGPLKPIKCKSCGLVLNFESWPKGWRDPESRPMKIHGSVSRKDQICTALGIAILLIGPATGNAIAMVIMSLAGLVLMTALYRKQLGAGFFIAAAVTVSVAATAFAIGRFMSIK